MEKEKFCVWFNGKFDDWRKGKGTKGNVIKFSEWLRIDRNSVYSYLKGRSEPSGENLFRIAGKLGFEVYEILGKPSPDLAIMEWQELYEITPIDQRAELLKMNKDWLKSKGIK